MLRTIKMKPALLLATAILSTSTLAQQTLDSRSFDQPCNKVQPAAVSYIQHTGLALYPDISCDHCFIGTTEYLRDPQGRDVSTKTAIKLYINPAKSKEAPGTWSVPFGLVTSAKLSFQQTPSQQTQPTCTAHLLFFFSWYATRFVGAMPHAADPASRPSNLHLETEYLDAIARSIPSSAPPKPN